jgi:hypothetical protein
MKTWIIAAALAVVSPAVAQHAWRTDVVLTPELQDMKAVGLYPYGPPIQPGYWCTAWLRYSPNNKPVYNEQWCGKVETWERWSKVVCLRQQEGAPWTNAGSCLAAEISYEKVKSGAEADELKRKGALDAKRQLHDMGFE